LEGTRALTATRARQLMGLPSGDEVLDFRDRTILKTYLYTGIRLGHRLSPAGQGFSSGWRAGYPHHQRKRQQTPHHRHPFRRR
jgi:hypothetical protein